MIVGYSKALVVCLYFLVGSFWVVAFEEYDPVIIVLTRGRSGSDFVSRLTENICQSVPRSFAGHPFGVTVAQMQKISDPLDHMKRELKRRRLRYPKDCIGFKWKVFVDTAAYDKALYWAASRKFSIIYSHRNPLDEFISRVKHDMQNLKSHCFLQKDGGDCVRQTQNVQVVVPVHSMMEFINNRTADVLRWRRKFDAMKAAYLEVNYEDLAFGAETARLQHLQRIADYILPNRLREERNVTMKDFQTDAAVTTSYNQSITVSNFDEVAAFLKTTQFSHLLHG